MNLSRTAIVNNTFLLPVTESIAKEMQKFVLQGQVSMAISKN